jgi:RecA/RadA recombinase
MKTKRRQFQAIADRLAGLQVTATTANFDGYRKIAWEAIDEALPGQEIQALLNAGLIQEDLNELMGMLRKTTPGENPIHVPSAEELARNLKPIEWLWPNWIPRGMITLLAAAPGSGKSFVALDLANRILQASKFPDEQPVRVENGRVLYIDAENSPHLHLRRAVDWKMDLSRLFFISPNEGGLIDLSKPEQQELLLEKVDFVQPDLIVIDALGNLSIRGENAVEDVRDLMAFLNYLSLESEAGLVIIHHVRKGLPIQARSNTISMDDVRGSGHIGAMARSILGLAVIQNNDQPKEGNGAHILCIMKSNISPFPEPLSFELVQKDEKTVILEWVPLPNELNHSSSVGACKGWLRDLLRRRGVLKPQAVVELAKEAGFSRSILYQARNGLGERIESTREKFDPENTWKWREE